ncbi:MAG: hypothetical protein ABGW97_15905 [Christiangramia sp.]|uniref:hypothetical protein n=1 Tax=Christiangramia sp. TaxID=1931228 RepID=UPI0032423D69
MTYQQKYRENKRLIEGYVSFLPECTSFDDQLKLSSEIGRLNDQNKQIEQMEYHHTKKDISDSKYEVNAILPAGGNPVKPLSTFRKTKTKIEV